MGLPSTVYYAYEAMFDEQSGSWSLYDIQLSGPIEDYSNNGSAEQILGDAPGDLIGINGNTWYYSGIVTGASGPGTILYSVSEPYPDYFYYTFFSEDPFLGGATLVNVALNPVVHGEGGANQFNVSSNSVEPVCFYQGTLIMTARGPLAVEELKAGDLLVGAENGELKPIRWIGRQTVVTRFSDAQRSYPIRIKAGALQENAPTRDFLVSPQHAVAIDGRLVQAAALVNGSTICQEKAAVLPERFTYFHIELEDHALILAEGVAAETFVDNVTRSRFDNYAEYVALYGEANIYAATGEMDAPRVKSPRQLPASIRARLAERAELLMPAAKAA